MIQIDNAVRYDRKSADYQYIVSVLYQPATGRTLDLRRINQDDWQFICAIGGYNDPSEILHRQARKRGVTIVSIDQVNTPFLGLAPVEESEGAISFVDSAGSWSSASNASQNNTLRNALAVRRARLRCP